MTLGNVFEMANAACSMAGSVFIARQDRRGYAIFIFGFLPASAFAVYYDHWAMLALYTYYLTINCYGYNRWRRIKDGR